MHPESRGQLRWVGLTMDTGKDRDANLLLQILKVRGGEGPVSQPQQYN